MHVCVRAEEEPSLLRRNLLLTYCFFIIADVSVPRLAGFSLITFIALSVPHFPLRSSPVSQLGAVGASNRLADDV